MKESDKKLCDSVSFNINFHCAFILQDGLPLEGGTIAVSPDGNTTTNTLSFTPTASDHGLTLSCRASNQMVPHSEMRDTWMLRVLYPPKVTLTLGHGLDANDIKEGADVYFECHLVANPWVSNYVLFDINCAQP